MTISVADITKLRKMTGAGMMDCKQALEQGKGDFQEAINILREKGKKVASKRADREASEGVVLAKVTTDGKTGMIVALACETDFVAKNEKFIAQTQAMLDVAIASKPATKDELKQLKIDGKTITEVIEFQTGVIGEKLELKYFDRIDAQKVVIYIHPGNKLASIVGFNQSDVNEQVGKDIAMQVAAMDPVAIDKDGVGQDVLDNEIRIGKELARQEGKAEEMLDKIAQGRLNKFFAESTLLNQAFVKDNKVTIKQYLEKSNKELKVTGFKRCALSV